MWLKEYQTHPDENFSCPCAKLLQHIPNQSRRCEGWDGEINSLFSLSLSLFPFFLASRRRFTEMDGAHDLFFHGIHDGLELLLLRDRKLLGIQGTAMGFWKWINHVVSW